MEYKNNHYVPKLILRRFSEKLCTYNIRTGEIDRDRDIASIFSEHEFYPVEVEKEFNQFSEAPFALILNRKILKTDCREEVELSRKEVNIIKKFLLLEHMRVFVPDSVLANTYFAQNPELNGFTYPFTEKNVNGETLYDRWIRNIRVILECTDLSHIQEHPQCTNEAYRWANIYSSAYLAIWDSSFDRTEFIVSDIGMTSELEESYFDYGIEVEKKNYLIEQIQRHSSADSQIVQAYQSILEKQFMFHENFYMFSISKHRMLVLINPFFRLYTKREGFPAPTIWPTRIKDRRLFEKNKAPRLKVVFGKPVYCDTDIFKYKVCSMRHDDILWINMLMLDRIDTLLGFTSLSSVSESINAYINWHKERGIKPRKDYTGLQKAIENGVKK